MNTATRETLHRVAAHVLGRRRFEATRRFGLRVTPGGFGTPAFGDGTEALRVAGSALVRESAGSSWYMPIQGSSLQSLARFAGANLKFDLSVGEQTPQLGEIDEPLHVDPDAAVVLIDWFDLGWKILDRVLGVLPASSEPAALQLWPEHFDVGTHVGVVPGLRVNLGASPGDRFSAEPYLYLGPWGPERPGDPGYWNAPFGAALARSDLLRVADPVGAGIAFLVAGMGHMKQEERT